MKIEHTGKPWVGGGLCPAVDGGGLVIKAAASQLYVAGSIPGKYHFNFSKYGQELTKGEGKHFEEFWAKKSEFKCFD